MHISVYVRVHSHAVSYWWMLNQAGRNAFCFYSRDGVIMQKRASLEIILRARSPHASVCIYIKNKNERGLNQIKMTCTRSILQTFLHLFILQVKSPIFRVFPLFLSIYFFAPLPLLTSALPPWIYPLLPLHPIITLPYSLLHLLTLLPYLLNSIFSATSLHLLSPFNFKPSPICICCLSPPIPLCSPSSIHYYII